MTTLALGDTNLRLLLEAVAGGGPIHRAGSDDAESAFRIHVFFLVLIHVSSECVLATASAAPKHPSRRMR